MKRFIIGRLSALALATLFVGGCGIASTSQDQEELSENGSSSGSATVEEDQIVGSGEDALVVLKQGETRPTSDDCAGCGPHPEPWSMGPHPEPWTEPKPSSSSSSSGGSGNGNVSGSGTGGKP